jgi:hypothetical protein
MRAFAACALVGGFKEATRIGIIDYIRSDSYEDTWGAYAHGEWKETFWKLWTLKQAHGDRCCAGPLPDQVRELDIWTLQP